MQQLLGYTVEDMLYEGPETCVRRATHGPSGARLVVKRPVSDSPSLRTVGRLLHEHQILGKLALVPGVVRCRGISHEAGTAALWLEDPGLRSLDRLLGESGRLSLAAALRIARSLCRALEGVHAAGVVHKDVKPQNILVDEACTQALLIDFGIASELSQEATEVSLPEALEGTLAYISPEQTGRTARGLDSRTDLYSLGVTLFEMITGKQPFLEKDALALVYAHLAKAPPVQECLPPGVPSAVARLLERCLEKAPEKRYQTAQGLGADLDRCLRLLQEPGPSEPFVLGQKDFSPRLQIPQTLVSREAESQTLTAAFARAAQGSVEVLLLAGPSGAGKTALVRSVYREIAKAGQGFLLSGKHDQLGRAIPYAAIAQAFSGLLRSLAASPKPVFDAWRERIDQALGPLARVIADLVPELEWLTGPLPAVQVVPTEMVYNRIKLSWIDFVRAVTDASSPLVLFLDDMQWVDPASLDLLKTLLTDVGRKHLLVIAAYRDGEVEPAHPLWELVEAVEGSGVPAQRLFVGPLDEASVQTWLAAALAAEPVRVRPLAGALYRKTQGNPFFLGQLLLELYRQQRVTRNLEDGTWHWDQDAVERAKVTDNVLELLLRKVVELPELTQELVGQAACAGHSFSLGELAVLTGRPPAQVSHALWPALLAGLVIPSDGQYREAQALAQAQTSSELDAGYRFLHDRVQQAFYERIAPQQRARTHLQIGRRLQEVFVQQGGSNQKQLELVRHLNLGATALHSEAERRELARLNLQAARAAKANGSYRLQATLVEQGQQLCGAQAWAEEPQLSVELALERIEADYMLREFDQVHQRGQELLAFPLPALPRLVAKELRVRSYIASGQYGDGESLGLAALAEQGIRYPETNQECMVQAFQGIGECYAWLDQHQQGFSAMPVDPSPERLLCDALSAAMLVCVGVGGRPALAALVMVRNVQQTIEKSSLTPVSPFFIGVLANAGSAFFGEYQKDVRWAQEGMLAAQRLASPYFPECSYVRGYYEVYKAAVEGTREHYHTALRAARASGSFTGTSWALFGELFYLELWGGRPLGQVALMEATQRNLMARAGDALGQHYFALAASYAAFLRAAPSVRSTSEPEWLTANSRSFVAMGDEFVAELARVQEAHLFLSFGEYARAFERAEEAELYRHAVYGVPAVTDILLWRGLAAAKCNVPTLATEQRASLLALLDQAIARFRYFSEGCAENFLHKLCLLEAEHARLGGNTDQAMAKYDEAITLARQARFLHIEALAAQFCAEFHLQASRERIAVLYLQEARDAYTRWDAWALVSFLEQKYPALLVGNPAAGLATQRTRAATNTTSTTGGVAIDVNTIVRAAQALASELDPERVVGRLMRLVQENAGAQSAVLLLCLNEGLSVVALLSGAQVRVGLAESLSPAHPIAHSIVQSVLRSREAIVLDDAPADSRFADDPHLRAAVVRSVLAMPLLHQGRLDGVLYLEHDETMAFPPSRVTLLGVLASQGTIALENARLYADLHAKIEALETRNHEVQQLNEELRHQIEQRSRKLVQALVHNGSATLPTANFMPGDWLGERYQIVRAIGAGGMGTVYEVKRSTDGRRLAAKVLKATPESTALSRFAREAQILARLKHPNLITIADVDFTAAGVFYIVMELVDGKTLTKLRTHVGDMPWSISVLRQIATALATLHEIGIVHRDLKPENVLIIQPVPGGLPQVKLVDFGIALLIDERLIPIQPVQPVSGRPAVRVNEALAPTLSPAKLVTVDKAVTEDSSFTGQEPTADRALPAIAAQEPDLTSGNQFTEAGVIMGTPDYIAPELVHGSRHAEPAADLFSFGVLAFELLVGRLPFMRPVVDSRASGEPILLPDTLRTHDGIPLVIAELIERCLDEQPGNRPTAKQAAQTLASQIF